MPKTKRPRPTDETSSESSSEESLSPSAKRQRAESETDASFSDQATSGSTSSHRSKSIENHIPAVPCNTAASSSIAAPIQQVPQSILTMPSEIIGLYVIGTWFQFISTLPSYSQLPYLVAYYQHLLPLEFHQTLLKGLQAIMPPVAAPVAMPPVFSPAYSPAAASYVNPFMVMSGSNPYLGPAFIRATQPALSQNAPSLPASFPAMSPAAAIRYYPITSAPIRQILQSPQQTSLAQAEPTRGTRV